MKCLEAVIANRARGSQADVHDGGPALQLVMTVAVKQIRRADRRARACRLDYRECGMIVHHIVGQQDFLPTTPPHVQGGEIIESSRSAHAREQPIIGFVPEPMLITIRRPSLRMGRFRQSG